MTKTTFAIAAALIAGTTLTNAANAGGLRVGFGFPLGSFIAHSGENLVQDDYRRRHADRPLYVARRNDDTPVYTPKKAPKADVASQQSDNNTKTAKLEDKLVTDDSNTTVIEKTSAEATDTQPTQTSDSSTSTDAATTDQAPEKVDTPKVEQVATVDNSETKTKSDAKAQTATSDSNKRVCRRFSAAIAGLVEVPCE